MLMQRIDSFSAGKIAEVVALFVGTVAVLADEPSDVNAIAEEIAATHPTDNSDPAQWRRHLVALAKKTIEELDEPE